jgi:hypothetical protein
MVAVDGRLLSPLGRNAGAAAGGRSRWREFLRARFTFVGRCDERTDVSGIVGGTHFFAPLGVCRLSVSS